MMTELVTVPSLMVTPRVEMTEGIGACVTVPKIEPQRSDEEFLSLESLGSEEVQAVNLVAATNNDKNTLLCHKRADGSILAVVCRL